VTDPILSPEQVQPPDPDRRRFFRVFATDVVTSVGSVIGAAQTLQQTSADAAREILGNDPTVSATALAATAAVSAPGGPVESDAASAGFRAPFRWDGDVCRVVDQRRLPDILVDLEIRTAADAVNAINDGAIVGAPVQAQVGAITLALMDAGSPTSRSFARRATIRGAANALRLTRPGSAAMAAALGRMVALLESLGPDADFAAMAAALMAEAERIIAETTDDHGAVVLNALALLPGESDAPLRVLVAGSTGAMGGGQFGTALSVVQTVHHAQRPVQALVAEGRPGFEGSRIAAWELRQAGVEHTVVTDAAGPGCIAAGEVDAVLVSAERIAANGDVLATAGTYPLALAAAAAGIPFLVCAATTTIDASLPSARVDDVEQGRPALVLRAAGSRIAPEGTTVRNPVQDLTPADLVTAIVTETGILRAPYGPAIAGALAAAAVRRAGSPGFVALLAQREAARAAADVTVPAPGPGVVDVAALRNPPRAPEA
jgi:methylthioribose-1-phosphate isomerase